MHKIIFLFALCFLIHDPASGQYSRYIVKLADKADNPFTIQNPSAYLSARSIQRRINYDIPIDSSDLPVTPRYIDSIRMSGSVVILNVSKWLNQVAIQTTDAAALAKINSFPFVISSLPIANRPVINSIIKNLDPPGFDSISLDQRRLFDQSEYGSSWAQIRIHQAEFLHKHHFRGEGMQMAIMDAGFYHWTTLPTFDSARNNNQFLGTWDYIQNETAVDDNDKHGMQCLSTIAANMPGIFVGSAPKTSFYLFRTEDINTEFPIEEHNWAVGIEKADSLGVDICSSSLGYSKFDDPAFNHTRSEMDGNTTICARAADFAAGKGMLVVLSAGNDGNNDNWRYIATPADADSAMVVGAVDTLGEYQSFSSHGPSADGDIKPSVVSVGFNTVVAGSGNGLPIHNTGTSFACPNMAGIATCLWQAFPEINNMGIIDALQLSAYNNGFADTLVGYGIPDAKKAFVICQKKLFQQQVPEINDCKVNFHFRIKYDSSMTFILERKLSSDPDYIPLQLRKGPLSFSQEDINLTDDLTEEASAAVYYRLKMVIDMDTSYYLDTLMIEFIQQCKVDENIVQVTQPYPNLTEAFVKVGLANASSVNIIVFDAIGRKVYSRNTNQSIGVQSYHIPLQQYSRGIYFVAVYLGGKKFLTREIMKQ